MRESKKLVEFTVVGNGPFPIDMLRRDSCFPHGEEDAATINSTLHGKYAAAGRTDRWVGVRLLGMRDRMVDATYGKYGFGNPTIRRWNRFGWFVVEVERDDLFIRNNNGCGRGDEGARKAHLLVDLWRKIKPGLTPNGRSQERSIEEDRMNEELANLCKKCRVEKEGASDE